LKYPVYELSIARVSIMTTPEGAETR